jgi:hypothetical protein
MLRDKLGGLIETMNGKTRAKVFEDAEATCRDIRSALPASA